ncbi:ferritin-like domain-containing protein [Mangrovibrevibacter kandeliae]|uniref:ferritin-like domain-containing protein n=1 Tax=Mangrovibrevibacter kandeliae TaxID=2968473 RepID=UPI0021178704|nr:ferritin-like domain-containing protein [Aurantimonas sp. CSK15Z-1]MCQ8780902.1 ferritin-like domain-containing protein [Aurantimonas sp. CSK15Z-1]
MQDYHQQSSQEAVSERRKFLKLSSAAVVGMLAAGLDISDLSLGDALAAAPGGSRMAADGSIDLGMGDVGILNYAYALEQLEAAFYTQVTRTPYRRMSSAERHILRDIRDHEIAHRDFFRAALGRNAIPALTVDFSKVDFGSRDSVLTTARTFEDLGVAAYNGGGQYLKKPEYLLLAGKIVSVEARHAATIRDLIAPFSSAFAGDDVVGIGGLDEAKSPSEVLSAARPFIRTPVTAPQLS